MNILCLPRNSLWLINFAVELYLQEGSGPTRLIYQKLVTLTNDKCNSTLVEHHKNIITPNNICTWGNLVRSEDEGTALIDAESRTLIGLSSLIFGENDGTYPDVYLRVQPYLKWIDSVIKRK